MKSYDSSVSTRGSYAVLAVMVASATVGGLTQNIMNTALPSVMESLSVPVSISQWLTNIFTLCLGIVIPLAAFLSRRFSYRSLTIAGMVLYLTGSLVIVFAQSFAMALTGRIMQGIAAGICIPLVQMLVMAEFPRERRGTLMGIVGIAMGFAPNIGPTIAGAFTSAWGWRSCFVFLAVFSAIVLGAALLIIKRTDRLGSDGNAKLDTPSLILSTVGFGGLLLGFSTALSNGFSAPDCWGSLLVGAVFLVVFVLRQLRIPNPMLNMDVFRTRVFSLGTVMICLLFSAFIGVTLVIPLYVQTLAGASALESGLVLFPGALIALFASPLSGWLMDKFGARIVIICSSCLLTVGTFMLLSLGNIGDLRMIALWQAVRAAGICSLVMPVTTWSLNALPKDSVADGTSVSNALRQVAAALGTAIMVLLMASGGQAGSITAVGTDDAMLFSFVMNVALLVMAILFVKKDTVRTGD